ncbi:hypothetical protein [Enterocloster sp.]|uniref:hypothetical protein n=1 Tax=Enterocloster sp. TaxID=2719315 RepID=UPI0039A02C22
MRNSTPPLQQKLVDAQENPPSNIVSSKIYEMQSYCMKTNHNFTTTIMAASPSILEYAVGGGQGIYPGPLEGDRDVCPLLTEDLSDGFFDEMQSKGTTVIELTTDELKVFQDVAKSVWPQVEEQMGSEAYNKLVDFVLDYQAKK